MRTSSPSRIALLDELRGLCVLLMVFYHAFYTAGYLLGVGFCRQLFHFFMPVEPLVAGIFIFLCGLCCVFSHSNLKRGLLLAVVAAGVSLVMAIGFSDEPIWFGVLHLLSVCILLYALLRPLLRRAPAWVGFGICAILFVLCRNIPSQYDDGFFGIAGVWTIPISETLLRQAWLYPLGLGRIAGVQGDYFPLLPWIFCFFAGSFLGRPIANGILPAWTYRSHVPPLSFLGRHALWIYILHQPVIYGIGIALEALLCR